MSPPTKEQERADTSTQLAELGLELSALKTLPAQIHPLLATLCQFESVKRTSRSDMVRRLLQYVGIDALVLAAVYVALRLGARRLGSMACV